MNKKNNPLYKHNIHWRQDNQFLKAVSLLGQLGFTMVIAITILTIAGLYIDKKYQTNGIAMAIGAVAGTIAGGLACYKMLSKFFRK